MWKKLGLGTAVVAVALIGYLSASGGHEYVSQAASAEPATAEQHERAAVVAAPPQAADIPIDLTAKALFTAYDANEVSADESYKGRHLRVQGTVTEIAKNFTDDVIVRLAGGNRWQTVDAVVEPAQIPRAAALKKGNQIWVGCYGNGMVVHSPQLRACRILTP